VSHGNERGGGILVLTMLYRPEPNFITADVAERLAAHEPVTVVTTHPNYPLGRFYEGVRRPWWPRRTVEGGVTVWRLPHLPDHTPSPARRLAAYLSFALTALVLAPFLCPRPHTVWVYQTPFTTALAALWFRLRGARVVYTAADLWPEGLAAVQAVKGSALLRLMFSYRRWINRRADRIVCATRGMVERYAADGVPRERLAYVPVWVDAAPRGLPAPSAPAAGTPRLVYAGNLGVAQGLEALVRAAAELRRRGVAVQVDVYGTGSSEAELRALAASLGATNVAFHGRVSPDEALRACASAHGQVVSLSPSPLLAMTVPSKLPFSFAAGAPVLYALQGEAAALARESGGAIPFDPDRPETLVEAVERVLALSPGERRAMGARLQEYFVRHFSPDTQLAEYEALLRDPALLATASAGRGLGRTPGRDAARVEEPA
jgi:glycosyltransferase involved in cell wall biosynthesis